MTNDDSKIYAEGSVVPTYKKKKKKESVEKTSSENL